MKLNRPTRYFLLLLIGFLALWLYYKNESAGSHPENDTVFNRALTPLIITRHARCRMDCRQIDENEIREILQKGKINYNKSNLNSKPDPKFALEGITKDNQQVRVIFAPTRRGMVVITCIDLNQEWECHCR